MRSEWYRLLAPNYDDEDEFELLLKCRRPLNKQKH